MDPFKNLPAEICLQILTPCSRKDFSSLCQASPALFHVWRANKSYLQGERLRLELGERVIRTALAVILFPKIEKSPLSRSERKEIWETTKYQYERKVYAGDLPDPWEDGNQSLLEELKAFVNLVMLYVQDCLIKQIRGNVPKVSRPISPDTTMEWPSLGHRRPLITYGPDARDRPSLAKYKFPLDVLSDDEYRFIFHTFFLYEYNCKIFDGPELPRTHMVNTKHARMLTSSQRISDRFLGKLSWEVYNLRNESHYLLGRKPTDRDIEILYDVFWYIRTRFYHYKRPMGVTSFQRYFQDTSLVSGYYKDDSY